MNAKTVAVIGVLGAAAYFAFGEKDANAKVPDPDVDCHSDDQCLRKRGVMKVPTKVTTVASAVKLTSGVGSPTGRSWVDDQKAEGFVVVTSDKDLVEGAILMATTPEDADTLVGGGLFRRVD